MASSSRRGRPLFASRNNPDHLNPSMKLILSFAALLFAAPVVQAQVVVTNPISFILSQTMHVEDIAKTVEMSNNEVKQITTLTQQLQQIQAYVKAFGKP